MTLRSQLPVDYLSKEQQRRIIAIEAFCAKHLSGIPRRSGESYAEHCREVALVLTESRPSAELLCTALLHDLLVHPDGKDLLRSAPVSKKERELIEQMYALRRLHIDENTKDLDTVIDAFLEQPELLPLRMAHRLNDVRHLDRFTKKLQKQIAQETLHMYAAIAGRLGMQKWRIELEDYSFPVVQPSIAAKLRLQFSGTKTADALCLTHTGDFLQKALKKQKINAQVEHRIKGLYSTYRKMVIKDRAFEDLTDRLALRIITKTPEDCYRALGVIHSVMHPIPGKLKDYIGAPKENGYRSIHTVVYPLTGVTTQPMELQIRTVDMHQDCEYGPAAHAEYKKSLYAISSSSSRVNLFRNLEHLRHEAGTPQQFEQALRQYFRDDHIGVFDAHNTVYHIKSPATALDFACMAYPKKCSRVKEIRINGRKQQLATPLRDGDILDVQFARETRVTKKWLQFCVHTVSRAHLKELIRN